MSELPDLAERRRSVNDSLARKNRWLRELGRRTDANGNRTPEQDREAREAAGIDSTDDERKPAA